MTTQDVASAVLLVERCACVQDDQAPEAAPHKGEAELSSNCETIAPARAWERKPSFQTPFPSMQDPDSSSTTLSSAS
jgi:hypothetical protein